jgi:flagellar biosynthesis protein FlhG
MREGILTSDQAEKLRRLVSAPRMVHEVAAPAVDPVAAAISVGPLNAAERTRPVSLARAIAVSSGKGGVGKTNLAVNLAVSFAQRGLKTALLDADLGLANADVLCGISPRSTLEDVVGRERSLEEVMVLAPGGFRLLPGASGVSRLADMGQSQRRDVLMQLMELERSVDMLIIDTGAGIGANSMAFAAAAHTIIVATTPEPTSIADAYGAIKTLVARGRRSGIQLVVNMVANDEEGRAVHARMDRVAKAFLNTRISYAGSIPHDPAVPAAVRKREPVAIASPYAPASRAIRQLARELVGEGSASTPPQIRQGFLARLTGFLASR